MLLYVILGVIVWIICGLIASGFVFAYFQRTLYILRHSNFKEDQRKSMFDILFGPIALSCVLMSGLKEKGWLWPWGKKAKEEAGLI